ncbi:MAG TPA: hypothetical protein VI461_10985 [Chitinophagaceae bacterium]|nr:hypothetical protein [Chitinophagaceae bacterium]
MKKLILPVMVAAVAALSVSAQEIPERKSKETKPVIKEKIFNKKERANLNLTEEQKVRLKSMNQDLRKQTEELKKQDNLTVKEYREKMEALKKDRQAQFHSVLTPEQKAQMEKDKEARKAKTKEYGLKKQAKMKEELKLTDEQSAKMTENRKVTSERLKAIREDNTLSEEQKKQETKEVMKKQKENMKSLLTEEQLKKMKENKKQHSKKKVVI